MAITGKRFLSWLVEVLTLLRNALPKWVLFPFSKPLFKISKYVNSRFSDSWSFCISSHHTAKKNGPWSMKEEQRLLRAVRDHIVTVLKSESPNNTTPKRVSREMLYQKLPWYNITLKVKTRNWNKCREKWWESNLKHFYIKWWHILCYSLFV